jgi:hypothetical protein
MKKTLCITALCAITALFSGCWKKKDKTDDMNAAVSTDTIMSDDKPIKVAALGGGPSDQNKLDSTNDEQAVSQIKEEAKDAEEKAEEAKEDAEEAKKADEKEEAEEAKEDAEEDENQKKK